MEIWPSKQPEKMSQSTAMLEVLENACEKDEARLSGESKGYDLSGTRELLTRAYPESFVRAKNILEGKE